jgi:hypothetical protein
MATGSRNWSGDNDFLIDIATLKRLYMDANYTQNLSAMIGSLKLLFYVSEPKLLSHKPEEEDKAIKWLEDNLGSTIFVDGLTGKQVETDGTRFNKGVLMRKSDETFRNLLNKLQKAGIYTRNTRNVKDVLGDFSGS